MNLVPTDHAQSQYSERIIVDQQDTDSEPRAKAPETGTWKEVEDALLEHHHKPDLEAARALCGAIAAHGLKGAPVWPMLVAPPGSMKTHLLDGFVGLPDIHHIDRMTTQTLLGGQLDDRGKVNREASLLHRIGPNGIIVYPDFSTVLSMKRDDKAAFLADMRRIYDGKLRKEFGIAGATGKSNEWQGRITFVVAVTPAIDSHYGVFQTLGERFVMIRWPRAGGIEAAMRAMNQDTSEAKQALQKAIRDLFDNLIETEPCLSPLLQREIAALSELAVRGRTHVPRNGHTKEMLYIPEPESATRLAQQLAQLAKGLALVMGRTNVVVKDLAVVRRVAFDSIPPMRWKILNGLHHGRRLSDLDIPKSTLKYLLEDLQALGLLTGKGPGDALSSQAKEWFSVARL
jgi:hypothetical protein